RPPGRPPGRAGADADAHRSAQVARPARGALRHRHSVARSGAAGACTAIIAGGELVLVDVGPGSWETVDLANLPTAGVGAALLTHFHSDHIGDLGEAVTQSWIAGRTKPLDVYGPPGVAQVVEGFDSAYAFDAAARVAHHRESHMPAAAGRAIAHEVAM